MGRAVGKDVRKEEEVGGWMGREVEGDA